MFVVMEKLNFFLFSCN